jgi:hypothetical protein
MLTDEQIAKIASTPCAVVGSYVHTFARAIESAATAPLLERIAGLERQLEQAVKFLRQGKAQFAPNTTNSDVDVFLSSFDNQSKVKP